MFFVLLHKWWREGWSGVRAHFTKALQEALIPAMLAIFLIDLGVAWHQIDSLGPEIAFFIPRPDRCVENPSACKPVTNANPKPDPDFQLIVGARNLADMLDAIHTQMLKGSDG